PRAEQASFRDRRAPGREKNGDVFAGRIHGGADHVGGPNADVHHYGWNFSRNHRIAMRHADRKGFMGGEGRLGGTRALWFGLGVGLYYRGEVGSGVAEKVIDSALRE